MSFSERQGLKPKEPIQLHGMTDRLSNRLWSQVYKYFESKIIFDSLRSYRHKVWCNEFVELLMEKIWGEFYGLPLDDLTADANQALGELKIKFFKSDWITKYAFVEYIVQQLNEREREKFIEHSNTILLQENSGYRFINDILAPIVETASLDLVQSVMHTPYEIAANHIRKALQDLSDKKDPDYAGCISNAIHAVEGLARIILNRPNAALSELSQSLTKLDEDRKQALKRFYNYASKAGRHAENKNFIPTREDALFILIVSSAYVKLLESVYHE